jgi:hypothetical protein
VGQKLELSDTDYDCGGWQDLADSPATAESHRKFAFLVYQLRLKDGTVMKPWTNTSCETEVRNELIQQLE